MSRVRRPKPPTAFDIADHWASQGRITFEDGGKTINPITDWGEPACQGCGCWHISTDFGEFESGNFEQNKELATRRWEYAGFEKAHIVSHEFGGSDTNPENFLLLCRTCHYDFDKEIYIYDKSEMDEVYHWLHDRETIVNKRIKAYQNRFYKDKGITQRLRYFCAQTLVLGTPSNDLYTFDHYLHEDELEEVREYTKKANCKPASKRLEEQLKNNAETAFIVMKKIFLCDDFDFLDEERWTGADFYRVICLLILRKLLKDKQHQKELQADIDSLMSELLSHPENEECLWTQVSKIRDKISDLSKMKLEDESILKKRDKETKTKMQQVKEYFYKENNETQKQIKNVEKYIEENPESLDDSLRTHLENLKNYSDSIGLEEEINV